MLKSMTGYGRGSGSACGCDFTVELRAVNHRYLDCSVRVPRMFVFLEDIVKGLVSSRLGRGKIDVFIGVEITGAADVRVEYNQQAAQAYHAALSRMAEELRINERPSLSLIARMPEVFSLKRSEPDSDEVIRAVTEITNAAISDLEAARIREGGRLCADISAQFPKIEELIAKVETRSAQIAPEYRARLESRLRDTLKDMPIEEPRLVTEAALFADKIANNEEIVRLRSHIAEFRRILSQDGAQGRRADFLIQEINREINTAGSKGNDAEIALLVVDLKAEIEKWREQVQNLE